MDRELKRLDTYIGANQTARNNDSDTELEDSNKTGLKSAIVVKSEQQQVEDEKPSDEGGFAQGDQGDNEQSQYADTSGDKSGADEENGGGNFFKHFSKSFITNLEHEDSMEGQDG